MKLTNDNDTFLISHFAIGIVLLTGFYVYRYKTNKTFKLSHESWAEFLMTSAFLGLGGYAALALIIFWTVLALVYGALLLVWYLLIAFLQYLVSIRWKILEWSIYILLLLGAFTQCTSKRVGAFCGDGTYSYATGRGACSWHNGVSSWDREYWWDWFDE
jgi:hypothetical protein